MTDLLAIAAAGAASMFDGLGWFADMTDDGKEIVCRYAESMEFVWTAGPSQQGVYVRARVTVSSGSLLTTASNEVTV